MATEGESHGYRFIPKNKALEEAWHGGGKTATIAAASVLLLVVFYSLGTNLTGFATHIQNLELLLNETKSTLDDANNANIVCTANVASLGGNLTECRSVLNNQSEALSSCLTKLDELSLQSEQLDMLLTQCGDDKNEISVNLESKKRDYDGLVRSNVRPLCCSGFDVVNSRSVSWNLSDNAITCGSGSYTVNCASGETNY